MPFYELECGKHFTTGTAKNIGILWRRMTRGKTEGFSLLARFRQMHPAKAKRKHRAGWGVWYYINPASLDRFGLKE
jgi:hypothetical protein